MKKLVLIALFSLISGSLLLAQIKRPVILNDPDYDVSKPLKFGFSLGLNVMDLDIRNSNKLEIDEDGKTFQY